MTASLYNLNCLVVGENTYRVFMGIIGGDHPRQKQETRGFGSWESPEFVLLALDVVEPESVT